MKVQINSFLEPPLRYNQDQAPSTNHGNLRDTEILCSFRLVTERKTRKEKPLVIKIRVPRKVFRQHFKPVE